MNYQVLAKRARAALAKAGTTIRYVRNSSTVDGVKGSRSDVPTTIDDVAAVVLAASKGTVEAFDNRTEDGSLKGLELRYLNIAAVDLPFTPKNGDVVTLAGKEWSVLGCTPIDPTGACPLIYGVGVMAL